MAQNSERWISVFGTNGDDLFLLSNGNNKAMVHELEQKVVGLYFAALSCSRCQGFTPLLIETYNEIILKDNNFEIILVSLDNDEDSFTKNFSTMPWLAIPHSYETARDRLKSSYAVQGTPHLIILNEKGDVVSSVGHFLVSEFGSVAFPFTAERIKELKDEEEAQKKNQTLKAVLGTASRDFVVSNDGREVSISELEGKMVGLYISLGSFRSSKNFTPNLIDFYKSLKDKGEIFEIVYVSLDEDKESYEKEFLNMPWLAIPFGDNTLKKLSNYFELRSIPTVVILGPDGKTINPNARDYILQMGIHAYPFSPEKLTELEELNKARRESQTLESLLVSDGLDFVIGKAGQKVHVSELVGKTVLFYFSRMHCPPCRAFTPKLAKTYHEIKAKHPDEFEVILVSLDFNEEAFKEYYSEMPWLTLPYNDKRETSLKLTFKPSRLPHLTAVGPNGKTLSNEAKELVVFFGADAYPFNEDRKKEMDRRLEEMAAKGWPEKVRDKRHAHHEVVCCLRGICTCDGCKELAVGWIFGCDECGFYLHPECVMSESLIVNGNKEKQENVDVNKGDGAETSEGQDGNEGWVCDGEACHKA